MRYLTFDTEEYSILDDGVAFDVRWDNTSSGWRIDVMSVTERAKDDVTKRNIYGSVLLKDILPTRIAYGGVLVAWDYKAQNNTVLAMITKATADSLRYVFGRSYDQPLDFATGGSMHHQIKNKMLESIRKEHQRLERVEHDRRRELYSIAFSNVTATSLTLTASGGPSGNTSRWEMRYREQGWNRRWRDTNSQTGNVWNRTGFGAGKTYEFEVRRVDDEYRNQEVWSRTHTRILPTQ